MYVQLLVGSCWSVFEMCEAGEGLSKPGCGATTCKGWSANAHTTPQQGAGLFFAKYGRCGACIGCCRPGTWDCVTLRLLLFHALLCAG